MIPQRKEMKKIKKFPKFLRSLKFLIKSKTNHIAKATEITEINGKGAEAEKEHQEAAEVLRTGITVVGKDRVVEAEIRGAKALKKGVKEAEAEKKEAEVKLGGAEVEIGEVGAEIEEIEEAGAERDTEEAGVEITIEDDMDITGVVVIAGEGHVISKKRLCLT